MRIITQGEMVWLPLVQGYVTLREVTFQHHGLIFSLKGKGGDTPDSTSQVVTNEPWSAQQPYLTDIFAQAQGLYESGGATPYTGETVAPLQQDTIAGQNYLRDTATNVLPGQIASGLQANDFALNGVLDVNSNPYLAQSTAQSLQPIMDNYTDQVLPAIRSGAGDAGQYGGSRQGIAEGVATGRLNDTLTQMVSQRYSDAYDRGLDTFDKGLALLPQTLNTTLMPGTVLDSVGVQNQNYEQQLLNSLTGTYDQYQNADLQKLIAYQGLIGGDFGGTSTGTLEGDVGGGVSGINTAVGGAATGAALASMLGQSTPWGAGIGALAAFL